MNAIVEVPEAAVQEANSVAVIVNYSEGLVVKTASDYDKAGEALKRVKAKAKALDELRKSLTKPLDDAKAKLMGFFRDPLAKLEDAERIIKGKMGGYLDEQEAIRRRAEAEAAEAARKERERLEREAAKEAEKARIDAEKAQARAEALEADGKAERAEAIRQAAAEKEQARLSEAAALQLAAASVTADVVRMPEAAVVGVSYRETWDFEIVNTDLIPREFLIVDQKAIGGVVRSLKGKTNIPGVRVFAKRVIASSSK